MSIAKKDKGKMPPKRYVSISGGENGKKANARILHNGKMSDFVGFRIHNRASTVAKEGVLAACAGCGGYGESSNMYRSRLVVDDNNTPYLVCDTCSQDEEADAGIISGVQNLQEKSDSKQNTEHSTLTAFVAGVIAIALLATVLGAVTLWLFLVFDLVKKMIGA